MSMIGSFKLVSPEVFRGLVEDPSKIDLLLYPDEPGADTDESELDVDKAWHGIHFLLTGSAWEGAEPLNFIVAGGVELGEDNGYGPPRGFDATQVKSIHASLERVSVEELRDRFDPELLAQAEIYPGWQPEGDEAFEYLGDHFERLCDLIAAGAKHDQCLLVYLT